MARRKAAARRNIRKAAKAAGKEAHHRPSAEEDAPGARERGVESG
jgi:hypothetical protein